MRSNPDPVHGASAPSSPLPATRNAGEDRASGVLEGRGAQAPVSDKMPAGYLCDTGKSAPHDGEGSQRIETRDQRVTFRVSPSEKAAFAARASRLGVTTGAWLRAVALDALDVRHDNLTSIIRARMAFTPHPELAQAVEQVRRVGVNLNQVFRKGLAVDDALLTEVLNALRDVRTALGDRTAL